MNRRKFIKAGLTYSIAAGSGLWRPNVSALSFGTKELLVVADTAHIKESAFDRSHAMAQDFPGFLNTLDLKSGEIKSFPLSIWAHKFTQAPNRPELAVGIPKWTPTALVVDVRTGEVQKTLLAPEGYRFFGHCAFDSSGQNLFVSAMADTKKRGGLCVFNFKTGKLIQFIDLASYVHECIRTSDNEIAVVGVDLKTNFTSGLIQIVDPSSFEIKSQRACIPAYHLAQVDRHVFAISGFGSPLRCELAVIDLRNGRSIHIHDSPNFLNVAKFSEALSLEVLSPSELVVTISEAHKMLYWNFRTQKVREFSFENITCGVARSKDRLYMNFGKNVARLVQYKWNGRSLSEVGPRRQFGNGRHMSLMRV